VAKTKYTGYELSRSWFDFCFENPDRIKPIHTALYFFAIEHCNRLGWKEKFGLPTEMTKDAIGVKSWHTYIKAFNDLIEWEFFILIERSKNQYSSNIIALSKNNEALDKAYDEALTKHVSKHQRSTHQSNDSIDKPITKEPITNNKPEKISGGNYTFIDSIIFEFKDAYEKANNLPYEITAIGKERGLAGKILNLYKKKNPGANSEQTIHDLRKYFDMCVTIDDNWLCENMSLGIIISQFNKINKILRHGKQRKGASDGEIAEILARHFGSDAPEQ